MTIRKKKETPPNNKILKIMLYLILIVASALTLAGLYMMNADGVGAFMLTMLCIYVFVGSLIKLCRQSGRLKETVFGALDLLFFLP